MNQRSFLKSLRGKLTLQTLVVGLVPLVVLGLMAYFSLSQLTRDANISIEKSREELSRDVVGANLTATARQVAQQIDVFMRERISDAIVWASAPTVIKAAKGADEAHAKLALTDLGIDDVEARFAKQKSLLLYPETDAFLRQQIAFSSHFGEIFFTDTNGFNVSMTGETSDFVQRGETWWDEAWKNGIHVGAVEFDDSADIWSVDISVRIDDPASGVRLGVMKAVLGVSLIQEVANQRAEEINAGAVTVMTREGLLLAETASRHDAGRIMNDNVNMRKTGTDPIKQAFAGEPGGYILGNSDVYGFARSAGRSFYSTLASRFDGFDWVVLVQQPEATAFAPIKGLASVQEGLQRSKNGVLIILIVAIVIVALLSVLLASMMSRTITVPVLKLRELADRVSRGDTAETIEVRSDDEIKDLAVAFERMRRSVEIAMRKLRENRVQATQLRARQ